MLALLAAAVLIASNQPRLRRLLLPLWVKTVSDVAYGPHPENRLDVMVTRFPAAPLVPAVLIFHGGGWARGSRHELTDRVCRRYLREGFLVVNSDYRLGAILPAADDAARALDWLFANASRFRIDRMRIVVTGESAGAHLALLAALRCEQRVAAVVNFYGPTDFRLLSDRPAIRAVLPTATDEATLLRVSPLSYIRRAMPPVFSIHGTADYTVPLEHAAALTRTIQAAGEDASVIYIDGGGHGLNGAQQEIAYSAVFAFLRQRRIVR